MGNFIWKLLVPEWSYLVPWEWEQSMINSVWQVTVHKAYDILSLVFRDERGFSELAWGKEFRERVDKVCEVQIVIVYGIFKRTVSCLFWP